MDRHIKGCTSCRPPESEISNEKSNLSENSLNESENLQPTCNLASNDCISREAAIDAVCKAGCGSGFCGVECDEVLALRNMLSAQPHTDAEIQKMQDLYQAEIDKAFELGQEDARSEIIHCRDCRYYQDNNGGYPHMNCKWDANETPDEDDFCSGAERRTDETD